MEEAEEDMEVEGEDQVMARHNQVDMEPHQVYDNEAVNLRTNDKE